MKQEDYSNITLEEFYQVWCEIKKQDQKKGIWYETPDVHFNILEFLSEYDEWENDIGTLMVCRGAGKSTIVGVFVVWMLVQNPTLRFLVLSATDKLAKKMVKDVQDIIQRHPLAKHLYPKDIEKTWTSYEIWVVGSTDARNPSVGSYGISSQITGGRCDFIVADDVESPKNVKTADLREQLRDRIAEAGHLLTPEGKILYIGTPHAYETIYEEVIQAGCSSIKYPLIKELKGEYPNYTGDTIWPERFNAKYIKSRIVKARTNNNFLSQYQLIPTRLEDSRFDFNNLIQYDEEPKLITEQKWDRITKKITKTVILILGEIKLVSVSAFWDPASGKEKRDDSAFCFVYSTDNGHYFIHRTVSLKGDVNQQCEQIKDLVIKFNLPIVYVETNGIGGFAPAILRQHLKGTTRGNTGMGCAVIEKVTTQNKGEKIIGALDLPLSAKLVHVHKSVYQSRFLTQLRDFIAGSNKKDDFIDTVASAILNEPKRIKMAAVGGTPITQWGGIGIVTDATIEPIKFG